MINVGIVFSTQLSMGCLQEVRRVMRQRAISVDLQPEIVEPCMADLGNFCADKVAKGEEMVCLQDNLDKIDPKCQEVVSNYTEEEAEHAELNVAVYSVCEPLAKRYCEDILKKDVDEGDLMQCLVEHKNDYETKINHKCKAAVEHFQLISLQDYHFNFKFKEACKQDVMQFCKSVHTKAEVVQCLSVKIRDDTLTENQHRITRGCRVQLRVELLQRNEDINLDPTLAKDCLADREKFCSNVSPGNAMVVECLKRNRLKLTNECHKHIFNREREEMLDNSIDYTLMTACKQMIKRFCPEIDHADMLSCLKDNKNELEFDAKCRAVVLRRMVQQNSDYRLNPTLKKSCSVDLGKFCHKIIIDEAQDHAFEGKVIECLKEKFRVHQLSHECGHQVGRIIREAQLDFHQDPILSEVCRSEIANLCADNKDGKEHIDDGKGDVEECLKTKFQHNQITNERCKRQVAKLVQQGQADIQADPLLYRACSQDVKRFCDDVDAGVGKKLSCLVDVLNLNKDQLRPECHKMLAGRLEIYEFAAKIAPETMQELIEQVVHSSSRNYFLVVTFAMIGMIFFGGLFCGRVTKRIRAEIKNK